MVSVKIITCVIGIALIFQMNACTKRGASQQSSKNSPSASSEINKVDIHKSLEYRQEIERRGIAYDVTSFLNAVSNDNRKVVDLFVKSGFDLNAGEKGVDAMSIALRANHMELAKYLVENGYSFDKNPYIMVKAMMEPPHSEWVRFALDNGVKANRHLSPEIIKAGGLDYLYAAIRDTLHSVDTETSEKEYVEIIQILVRHGADRNAKATVDGVAVNNAKEFATAIYQKIKGYPSYQGDPGKRARTDAAYQRILQLL